MIDPMYKKATSSFFTIIELFVMIAVFAILASLVIPAMKRTLEHSQILQCKNILKHFSIADELYADDHGEMYVLFMPIYWSDIWLKNAAFLSLLDTDKKDLRDEPELTCPNYTAPSYLKISYAPNWTNDKVGGWNEIKGRALIRNRIEKPSQKIKMAENSDWHPHRGQINNLKWYVSGEVGSNTITYRHLDGCNILFIDGHIEYKTKEDVYLNGDTQKQNETWQINGSAFADVAK